MGKSIKKFLKKDELLIHYGSSFEGTLKRILAEIKKFQRKENIPEEYIIDAKIAAPILYFFSVWVLKKAKQDGINRLYFLARDGYIPWIFSKRISNSEKLGIECRYLYCSRRSLRIPCAHLLNKDEMIELIGSPSINLSYRKLLERVCCEKEVEYFLSKYSLNNVKQEIISNNQREDFLNKLKTDTEFIDLVMRHSKEEYFLCRKYFIQEGLNEGQFGIVDTGWTGSIQHCFQVILTSMGYDKTIYGYYYGLFQTGGKKEDGCLVAFDFDGRKSLKGVGGLCNNLLECMAYGPYGMTIGYRQNGELICPAFSSVKELDEGKNRDSIFKKFSELADCFGLYKTMDDNEAYEWTKKTLRSISSFPAIQVAEFYGRIRFSDDILDIREGELAHCLTKKQLHQLLFPIRFYFYLIKKPVHLSYWECGSVSLTTDHFRKFYQKNIIFWENIRLKRQGKNRR